MYLSKVQQKPCGKIAKIERMSLRDIDRILKEDRGEKVSWTNVKVKDNSKNYAAMNKLFIKRVQPVQVSIDLNVSLEIVLNQYEKYLIATRLERVVHNYEERGDFWLDAVNEITDAMKQLGLPTKSALELFRYAWRMQEAGNSVQMLRDEEARIDGANYRQLFRMMQQEKEHEEKISRLFEDERRILNRIEAAKIEPERTTTTSPLPDVNNITDHNEFMRKFWDTIDKLARDVYVNPKE